MNPHALWPVAHTPPTALCSGSSAPQDLAADPYRRPSSFWPGPPRPRGTHAVAHPRSRPWHPPFRGPGPALDSASYPPRSAVTQPRAPPLAPAPPPHTCRRSAQAPPPTRPRAAAQPRPRPRSTRAVTHLLPHPPPPAHLCCHSARVVSEQEAAGRTLGSAPLAHGRRAPARPRAAGPGKASGRAGRLPPAPSGRCLPAGRSGSPVRSSHRWCPVGSSLQGA